MNKSPMASVAPELRPYLSWMHRFLPNLGVNRWTLPLARWAVDLVVAARMPGSGNVSGGKYRKERIAHKGLAGGIKVYGVGTIDRSRLKPAVLFIHGGGFISGSARESLPRAAHIAMFHDCIVIVPKYSLAPEATFPCAREELYATLRWMNDRHAALGIDPRRIALMGESAGGGHAASLTQAVRDRGEFKLAAQILIYPMLDDRTGSARPVPFPVGRYGWTAKLNRFGWSSLLGVPAGSAKVAPEAVPARATDLAGLPPAFIGVGDIDLFFEEDVSYAQRLQAAGVKVDLMVVKGAYHGFNMIAPETKCSRAFESRWQRFLAEAFAS
jgi:acetyl esterase/lipase